LIALVVWTVLAATQPSGETIVAVQIHGNTVTSDDEVRRLAGIDVGNPVEPDTLGVVTERLRATKRFQSVRVLKRFASIADPTQIVLVIIVDEGPVSIETSRDPDQPARVVRSRRSRLLFLPVLNFEDGYGFTYGARFAWPDPIGKQSRVAFPLTWGGDKRAAAELEKNFERGPFDRLLASGSISRRTNPYYDADDARVVVSGRAERQIVRWVRAGATLGWQRVSFPSGTGAVDDFGYGGADIVFDTRADAVLPRNAVYARAAWEHIAGANRADLEARGYVGLFGQTILAIRGQRISADQPLPPYLKPLLGGMSNLRGFEAGTAAGDNLVVASAEVIVPLTSPLSFGRFGVTGFADTGTVYNYGQRLADQKWLEGFGGSVWLSAAFFRVSLAVAHGRDASTRVHLGANVTF
jgi:outer membrane protein assembly factor BamA